MRSTGPWIAFLATLFLLVGLCGLFASYAVQIPLERAIARSAMLDGVLADADPAGRLARLEPTLGSLAGPLKAPGPLAERVARARGLVQEEQGRETASLNYRIRLMLVVITLVATGVGGGILALARKSGGAG